jgi:hypothetical protein
MVVCVGEYLEMRRMSVKMDAEILKKAKMVAADREQTVIEYLEEIVAPQVQRDLEAVLAKLTSPAPAPKRKRGES